jgi:hypothetical protein
MEGTDPAVAVDTVAGAEGFQLHSTPSLYRSNAFRVIGVPTEAGQQDLRRRADALRMAESLGTPAPQGQTPLPLTPPASGDDAREAMQRLRDPERRLVDEVFWFWPVQAGNRNDAALSALSQGDFARACQIWRNTDAGGIGLHNLAVLNHAMALDHEIDVVRGNLQLSAEDRANIDRLWRQTYADWKKVLDADDFWIRLAERVRAIDDPRVTRATVSKIRASLPMAIVAINAQLAVEAGERSNDAESARHMTLVRNSGFDSRVCQDALRSALSPLKQRIEKMCSTAETEAAATPRQADKVATRLLDQTAPLLRMLDFLPAGHALRDAAHDQVAQSTLNCQIPYGQETEDWQTSLTILERAVKVAAGDTARQRLQMNLQIVADNLALKRENGTCWFCGTAAPTAGAGHTFKMHGDVQHEGSRVKWRVLDVTVPRCADCKKKHSNADSLAILAFAMTAVLGFTVCGSGGGEGGALAFGWIAFFGGFAVAALVAKWAKKGVKGTETAQVFPAALRLKSEGWALGEKPSGVQ